MIRNERPPNYDAIVEVFPHAKREGIVFAYGEDIYNPSGVKLSNPIVAHEYKHCARQFLYGAEQWWQVYLSDQQFRYSEELKAHGAEFREAIKETRRDRNAYAKLMTRTAHRLIAPLYNYEPKPTLRQALLDLRAECGV